MVTLTISPKKGNHTRHFPHSGYLGLTPVVVTGVVETRLEEDNQPIQASRLIVRVRCYEAIGTSLSKGIRPDEHEHQHQRAKASDCYPVPNSKFSNVNVLWQTEKVLWSASHHPHGQDDGRYDLLGDWKGSWKLVVPVDAVSSDRSNLAASNNLNHNNLDPHAGCAIGSITYKSWRSWWQVETVIYHKPAGILGTKIMKSHALYLVNYGEAQKHYSRSIEESRTSIQSTTRMTNRNIRYSITAPTSVCCGDEVELKVRIGSSHTNTNNTNNNSNSNYNQHHPSRAIPASDDHSPPLDHHHRLSEPSRPTTSRRVNDLIDRSNRSEISLKRIQVSLVRKLAIELIKTSAPTNDHSSPSSTLQVDDRKSIRLGKRPVNMAIPSQVNPNNIHNSIGPSSASLNSKTQLTTFNTLTTNTEGISKSNIFLDLSSPHRHSDRGLVGPPSPNPNHDGYDVGFIVKLKIPIAKSKSHYSIGESFKTNSTTVNFSFQFKLSIKNKLTNRVEIIELSELSVQVFSISKDQIKCALDQLNSLNHPSTSLVYSDRLLLNTFASSSKDTSKESLADSARVVAGPSRSFAHFGED